MSVTGTTFNFKKQVTTGSGQEPVSTPSAPNDNSKPTAKVAGEKTDQHSTKSAISVQLVTNTIKSAVNSALSSVEGSQLKAQVSALQQGVSTVVSTVVSFSLNPYVGMANLALQGVSYGLQADKFNRDKAWSDYDREQYILSRGYSSSYTRNRS